MFVDSWRYINIFFCVTVCLGDFYMCQTNVACETDQCYSVVGMYDNSSVDGN